jgi:putative AlgH/UPF0301 family transcriptional regulator
MIEMETYRGQLLGAHPRRRESLLRGGVVLVVDHDAGGSIGLQINRAIATGISIGSVMNNMGLSIAVDQPLYVGGTENTNRIIIVHTMDWSTDSTVQVTDNIGYSNDISVLSAISSGEGPEQFRAVAGFMRWPAGQLEREIAGEVAWGAVESSWSLVPATCELVFDLDDQEQWRTVLETHARQQIAIWF